MKSSNLLGGIPTELPDELTEILVTRDALRIERIVSRGHSSPADFWYDQEENEWVLVLSGKARLRFAEAGELIELGAGDFLTIPAHSRHRVEWTDPNQDTIWLAIFYS
jgi:cupin 2 domain-containing protein